MPPPMRLTILRANIRALPHEYPVATHNQMTFTSLNFVVGRGRTKTALTPHSLTTTLSTHLCTVLPWATARSDSKLAGRSPDKSHVCDATHPTLPANHAPPESLSSPVPTNARATALPSLTALRQQGPGFMRLWTAGSRSWTPGLRRGCHT